jgi:colanic acid biosynthesis glycosyl transferase WcaI
MRVLVLAQYFPPDMGGGATRAYNIAKGLSLVGCDVTVIAAFPHYPSGNIPKKYRRRLLTVENEGKIKVIRTFVPPLASKGFINRLLLFSSFVLSSILAMPFTKKVDATWAANPNVIAVFPSLFYGLVNRCPVFQNVDDLWPETLYDLGLNKTSPPARFFELMARITYSVSSGITSLSPGYVNVIETKYGISRNKISVVLVGVDPDQFCTIKEPTKKERFRVLYIGSFSPAYNFDQILKAAQRLSTSNVEFVIQGGGELAHELKCKIQETGLNNIRLIEKIVSRGEVAEIMAQADALILPLNGGGSIEMGISSKIYEYQAAGKPIICCSNGETSRYVLETKSGLVVKPGDIEMLVNSICYLMKNPDFAQELGNSGKNYVLNNLSIKQIGLKMEKILYQQIANFSVNTS